MAQALAHRRLSAALGVEVVGVDLRETSEAELAELGGLLAAEHLVVVRGQELTADDQVRVVGRFGTVDDELGDGAPSYYISNARPDGQLGEVELRFHSDWTWTPAPVVVASLYAEEIAGPCPPTRFANTARALAQLPAEVRERVASLEAVHLSYQPAVVHDAYSTRRRLPDLPADVAFAEAPHTTQPVVAADPLSGEPVLFVNSFYTSHLVDVPLDEGEALLADLFARIQAPDNVYEHAWTPGDLVLWDNFAVQHARAPFQGTGARRTLRRVSTTARGESPVRAVGISLGCGGPPA
jgi:alpha-ketoglutarate-dependent taurine dioxygenase